MKVEHNGQVWEVAKRCRSIMNGSLEFIITRPGHVKIASACDCREINENESCVEKE